MKRIILILTIGLLASVGYGQTLGQTTIISYDISVGGSDALIKVPYDFETGNYAWRLDVVWDSVAGTADGILKVKATALPGYPHDTAWVDYPNMSSVTINSVQGECSFEDTGLRARRIGVNFDMNSITDGRLRIYLTLKPR